MRFVIGGTFADVALAAAVPMLDLAERDDAPVRPVNPLTGDELTPEQARTFHAVIGQPWKAAASAAPTGATSPTVVRRDPYLDERKLNAVLMIVALSLVLHLLLRHQWRRSP